MAGRYSADGNAVLDCLRINIGLIAVRMYEVNLIFLDEISDRAGGPVVKWALITKPYGADAVPLGGFCQRRRSRRAVFKHANDRTIIGMLQASGKLQNHILSAEEADAAAQLQNRFFVFHGESINAQE